MMERLPIAILCALIALIGLVISVRSFREKGFLFNNAYLWASQEERAKMDKKPHYRQTAVVFLLLSALFGVIGAEILLETGWLWAGAGGLCAAVTVYAVRSSIT